MKNKNQSKSKIRSILVLLFLVLVTIPLINANFICGQLKDASNNVSAEWFKVRLSYPNLPKYSECEVSPQENKYCCDTDSIPGKTWKIGDTINSELYDPETGYMASLVFAKTTGDAYTILPEMTLKKAITVYDPILKIYLRNTSIFHLNATFESPYNYIQLNPFSDNITLCNNCTSLDTIINSSFGMNHYILSATDSKKAFTQNIDFANLQYLKLNQNLTCKNCKNNIVNSNQNITITLNLNSSDYISGMELRVYVPNSWDIIDSNGANLTHYSSTHNQLSWIVSGKNMIINYTIHSPSKKILNRNYLFKTQLENINFSDSILTVNGILPFFSLNDRSLFQLDNQKKYPRVNPGRAMISQLYDESMTRVGVFVTKKLMNVKFNILNYKYGDPIPNTYKYYIFETNIQTSNIDKLYIEFRVSKSWLIYNSYQNVSLMILNNQSWIKVIPEKYKEDKFNYYFRTYAPPGEGFAIIGEN